MGIEEGVAPAFEGPDHRKRCDRRELAPSPDRDFTAFGIDCKDEFVGSSCARHLPGKINIRPAIANQTRAQDYAPRAGREHFLRRADRANSPAHLTRKTPRK